MKHGRCRKTSPVRNLRNARSSEMRTGGVNHRNEAARSGPRTSPSRTRTYNLAVNSRSLYQLSYRGKVLPLVVLVPASG